MEKLLQDFAGMYKQRIAEEIYKGDESRTVRNPILFVFIGDRSKDALVHIQKEVLNKWKNGEGMLFLQIGETVVEEKDRVYSFGVSTPIDKDKAYRQKIYKLFYENSKGLLELNQTIGKIRNHISKVGNLYATCEKVHICIISQVDDPLNVLVQDIGVLLKTKIGEKFKQVAMDFYGLIQEQEEKDYSINCATAMSFFRELEYMQSEEFYFKGDLEIVEENMFADPIEKRGPLFDLNYFLSNKNEKGILSQKYMENNYRMIATMNILKNRYDLKGFNETNNQLYNDGRFKQQLLSSDNRNAYVSLGLGKVQRPNKRIAFTVLLHFYNYIFKRIKKEGQENESLRVQIFGYDRIALKKTANKIVPDEENLNDMQGILSVHMKSNEASKQTFKELENNLYGDVAQGFFKDNFEKVAADQLGAYRINQALKDSHGFFWIDKDTEKTVLLELHSVEKSLTQDMVQLENELNDLYHSRISTQQLRLFPWAEKKNMREIKKLLFQSIYTKKLEILTCKIQIELVKMYGKKAQEIYEKSIKQIEELNQIGVSIKKAVRSYEKEQDGYLEKNIKEYYKTVTDNLLVTMEKRMLENFQFDDRFMGNPYILLDQGKEAFLKQLIKVCEKDILSNNVFKESFEEELLNRANVAVTYGDQGTLTKQDLFDKLYFTLEEASNINIYTYRYTQKNPHTEKYYFGDYYSDLMQYIFKEGEQREHQSVGCIHEKRTSGIEVLRIMGGFRIQDLIYIKSCKKYYDLYLKEGYLFHGIDPVKLPEIEFSKET